MFFSWFSALGFDARSLKPMFPRPAAWRALGALVGTMMLTLAGLLIVHALPQSGWSLN